MRRREPIELFALAKAGDRGALARLVSLVDEQGIGADKIANLVGARMTVPVIGVTGPPGAGKSTLVDRLVTTFRARSKTVCVLAIDPSSPFSGGAILGDRVRMSTHITDEGVFIRSLATRGAFGGLTVSVPATIRLLNAVGFDQLIVETVGVGQIELDVATMADTVVVVVNPGWGDEVQAAKAGLMEIADVFVVNKSDRPGAAQTESDLLSMSDLATRRDLGWTPPVVRTSAMHGDGIDQLSDAINAHQAHLTKSGDGQRRQLQRVEREIRRRVAAELIRRTDALASGPAWDDMVAAVCAGELSLVSAANALLLGD